MKNALFLLFMVGMGFITIHTIMEARTEIQAANPCYAPDSGLLALGFFKINKDSIKDESCEQIEAARMATELGMYEEAKFIVCSHAGAKGVFGDVSNCMDYNGNYQEAVETVNDRHDYCNKRSKKWYRKVTFGVKKKYRRCMRGE